jgi:hypothetical protein
MDPAGARQLSRTRLLARSVWQQLVNLKQRLQLEPPEVAFLTLVRACRLV